MILDEKGRCCGRKPIQYKGGAWNSPARPQLFCPRCDRAYHPETEEQIENWAWGMDYMTGFFYSKKKGAIENDTR